MCLGNERADEFSGRVLQVVCAYLALAGEPRDCQANAVGETPQLAGLYAALYTEIHIALII